MVSQMGFRLDSTGSSASSHLSAFVSELRRGNEIEM